MKNNAPSNSSNVWDKTLDVLLEAAADMSLEQLDKELPEPAEDIEFSIEHERKMKRLFRRERSKLTRKKILKYTGVASVGLVALILCAGITIASVDAWRAPVLNYMLDLRQPNTDFDFSGIEDVYYENDKVKIKYVPQGFELTDGRDGGHRLFLQYENGEQYFQITVGYSITMDASIDTENGTVEDATLNGHEAVYASTPLCNSLISSDGEYIYIVCGNVEREEIFKIAENIRKN